MTEQKTFRCKNIVSCYNVMLIVQCDQDEDFLQISQKGIMNITTVTDQEATHGPPPTSVGTVAGV